MRCLWPSVYYSVTRHLFFYSTHDARSPQYCLANIHHLLELLLLQHASISQLLTLYPFCMYFSERSFGCKEQRPTQAGSTNCVKKQEGGAQVIVRRTTSHGTPKKVTTVGPGTGIEQVQFLTLPPEVHDLSGCLCSSLHYLLHSPLSVDWLPPNFG